MSGPSPVSWRSSRTVLTVAGIAAVVLGGLAGGVAASRVGTGLGGLRAVVSSGSDSRCPATAVADRVLPSVVTLNITAGTSRSNGTGEVIRGTGYIVTNDHVIAPAAGGGVIDALLSSGESRRATIVGRVPRLDLAVVKVDAPKGLPVIAVGRSASLRVGQPVVALGAPLGLTGTVTSGIVSALGRSVPVPAAGGESALLPDAIQTDASINPGNSGGALVDCSGSLVGINTAIATVPNASGEAGGGSVGIGFAIPVDLATVVVDEVITTGTYAVPYLGMTTTPVPAAAAERFGVQQGLFVQAISAGGPADTGGLHVGDVVTEVDGHRTDTPDDLFTATVRKRPGDRVTVRYVRASTGPSAATATVTLAAPP